MNKTEKIVLWVVLGITFVSIVVSTVVVAGELKAINKNLRALRGGQPLRSEAEEEGTFGTPRPLPTAAPGSDPGGAPQVAVAGVQVLSDTVTMTVTVRSHGAGDLLYEPPVLRTEEGQVYPVDGDCLEEARLAFLDLVTKGQATARLAFVGRLAPSKGVWLVFNPDREEGDVIAPHLAVPVPVRGG